MPLVTGVSELSTDRAVEFARDAERIGVNAPMVLPAMVYVPTADQLYIHFKMVAEATSLPIMLYTNPPAYRVSIELGAGTAGEDFQHRCDQGERSRSATLHRHHQCIRRSLHAAPRPR